MCAFGLGLGLGLYSRCNGTSTNPSYLLDTISGVAFGYSWARKIGSNHAYPGRVRRGSDNAEIDAQWDTSGNLETTELEIWINANGSSDAFLVSFQDAFGSYHMSQSVLTRQPKIYDAITGFTTNELGVKALHFLNQRHTLKNNSIDKVFTTGFTSYSLASTLKDGTLNILRLNGEGRLFSRFVNRRILGVARGDGTNYSTSTGGITATTNTVLHVYELDSNTVTVTNPLLSESAFIDSSPTSLLPQEPKSSSGVYNADLGTTTNGDGLSTDLILGEVFVFDRLLNASESASIETNIRDYYGI